MSVRSFHSVFMASAVAGAALGCYLISLRVASERAALQQVENEIVLAQRDIRLLQTEIGTRGRLAQLERWNVRVLSLSAPTADQILGDKFQLASLVAPEPRLDVDAPVVLAAAPAPEEKRPLEPDAQSDAAAGSPGTLLHEASVTVASRDPDPAAPAAAPAKPSERKTTASKTEKEPKKAGDKRPPAATTAVTAPVRTAKIDPLAPLATDHSTAKGSRTNR